MPWISFFDGQRNINKKGTKSELRALRELSGKVELKSMLHQILNDTWVRKC